MTKTNNAPKIFGIGLNKTGTTTLGQCGKILGYRCTSCSQGLLEDIILNKDFSKIKEVVAQFDLFEDWPWPLIYKELDQMFPGSKFILTTRANEKVWFNSLKKHSLRTHPTKHCRKLAYGYNFPQRYEQEHIEFYNRHNNNVRKYFREREHSFIELCWENGDGFQELCNFLDKGIPVTALPHTNKGAEIRTSKKRLLVNKLLSLFT